MKISSEMEYSVWHISISSISYQIKLSLNPITRSCSTLFCKYKTCKHIEAQIHFKNKHTETERYVLRLKYCDVKIRKSQV